MPAAEVARKPFVGELLGRGDFAIISELVEPHSKVLDLGCGEGELLAWLAENKGVEARGVEISATKVRRAIARGVSAYQGDIDEVLADYSDHAFDYVILSQTLQETRWPLKVMRDMLRVGRHAIVAFPNFGHWSVRLSLLFTGHAPKTGLFPHEWYDSPNIHFLTVDDFDQLVRREGFTLERCYFLEGKRRVSLLPNLRAEVAVYLVSK
jgi:methionine biosynthesis protein MetW